MTDLPPFTDLVPPSFMWGDLGSSVFSVRINEVYEEAVHWRRNLFAVPRGKAGLLFVRELSRLLEAFSEAMVFTALVLQRPHPRSSCKDHSRCLEDRLSRWLEGDINSLLHESHSIQGSLHHQQQQNHDAGKRARLFEKLVPQGNVKAAIRLITEQSESGCLLHGRTVKDHLLDKHPPATLALQSAIREHPPATEPHPIIFDRIVGPMIRTTAQLMSGSASPSGLDERAW